MFNPSLTACFLLLSTAACSSPGESGASPGGQRVRECLGSVVCGAFEQVAFDEPVTLEGVSVNQALGAVAGTHLLEGLVADRLVQLTIEVIPGESAETSAATQCAPRSICGTNIAVDARVRTSDQVIDARIATLQLHFTSTSAGGEAMLETPLTGPLPGAYSPPAVGSDPRQLLLSVWFAVSGPDGPRVWADLGLDGDFARLSWLAP